MSVTQSAAQSHRVASLPGRPIIAGIRRLLIVAIVTALMYPAFMVAGASYCAGGYDGSGGFIDADGQPVGEAPRCVELTLGPSPLVFLTIAVIVIVSIGRVENAADQAAALRTLRRGMVATVALALAAVVISMVWFRLVPIEDFVNGGGSIFSPFPFGLIDVSDAPMLEP